MEKTKNSDGLIDYNPAARPGLFFYVEKVPDSHGGYEYYLGGKTGSRGFTSLRAAKEQAEALARMYPKSTFFCVVETSGEVKAGAPRTFWYAGDDDTE